MWLTLSGLSAVASVLVGALIAWAVGQAAGKPHALDSAAFWWLGYPILLAFSVRIAHAGVHWRRMWTQAAPVTRLAWLWPILALQSAYFCAMRFQADGRIDEWWHVGMLFMAIYAAPASILAQWWSGRQLKKSPRQTHH